MGVFDDKGLVAGGLRHLNPSEAAAVLSADGATLIDIRADYLVEMKRFLVPSVAYATPADIPEALADLPHDRPVLVADSSGVFTKAVATTLISTGFEQVACLNGGMIAWDNAGMPVETDAAALLHGDCACVMRSQKSGSR